MRAKRQRTPPNSNFTGAIASLVRSPTDQSASVRLLWVYCVHWSAKTGSIQPEHTAAIKAFMQSDEVRAALPLPYLADVASIRTRLQATDTQNSFRRECPLLTRKLSLRSRHVLDAERHKKETGAYRLNGAAPIPTQSTAGSRIIDRRFTAPPSSTSAVGVPTMRSRPAMGDVVATLGPKDGQRARKDAESDQQY
jgi:hypothetical protein